jgi:hypothetical protein
MIAQLAIEMLEAVESLTVSNSFFEHLPLSSFVVS